MWLPPKSGEKWRWQDAEGCRILTWNENLNYRLQFHGMKTQNTPNCTQFYLTMVCWREMCSDILPLCIISKMYPPSKPPYIIFQKIQFSLYAFPCNTITFLYKLQLVLSIHQFRERDKTKTEFILLYSLGEKIDDFTVDRYVYKIELSTNWYMIWYLLSIVVVSSHEENKVILSY